MNPSELNPSISFVIGNSELTNLLVQNKVRELTAEKDRLQEIADGLWKEAQSKYPEIRNLVSLCIEQQWGKKLSAYTKAFGVLIGKKLCWEHQFIFEDGRTDYYVGELIDRKSNKYEVRIYFEMVIPEKKVLSYMEKSSVTLHDALLYLRKDTEEFESRAVEIELSEDLHAALSYSRAMFSDRAVVLGKIREINALLSNMPEIEKQILAQMTTNMLEQNPQLLAALNLAAKGLSLPDSLKLLE